MLDWALEQNERPVVIRVPGNGVASRPDLMEGCGALGGVTLPDGSGIPAFETPAYQTVRAGSGVAVLALGSFFNLGERVCDALEGRGVDPTLVNPRFATELDEGMLDKIAASHRVVVTLEDGVLEGGWGEKVARYLGGSDVRVLCYGVRKGFPDRYDARELLEQNGVSVEHIVDGVLAACRSCAECMR